MPVAMRIPNAKQAVDDECDKLANGTHACSQTGRPAKTAAWDIHSVRPKAEVQAEAKRLGITTHFGSLMDLCHEKHSELAKSDADRIYKGRVVFRGDQVRDENGFYAVFSEQSASASQMAAAKFMDAIARFPGNDGEDSDARAAYTQVELADVPNLLNRHNKDTQADTWITLPKNRRPQSWDNIQDPVCLLKRNLYGHNLAGLIWEKHCHKHVYAAGFQKVPGWECLFVHKTMTVFLSIYVDDFRMAGQAANLPVMWELLRRGLDLDPPTKSATNTYLGCNQQVTTVTDQTIQSKTELFQRLLHPEPSPITTEETTQTKPKKKSTPKRHQLQK
jgi:hypothetical protein